MPRRRLSERQIERIRTIQERRRQRLADRTERVLAELDEAPPAAGTVVVRHGANLAVEDGAGRVWHCLARQNIGDPVCGDEVVWQSLGPGQGIVTALQPRRTLLSRPDHAGRARALAANLDQLVIVLAPRPEPSPYLLDQYLVAAELIGVRALIAVTKMDLIDDGERPTFEQRFAHYGALGYPLLWLSLRRDATLAPLVAALRGHTSILVGQSGVGKSSLVKTLLPDREIQIGRLSQATGLGRHTTSATTRYRLAEDSFLIDSPGVRSFRLGAIDPGDLARGFRELAPLVGHCRFGDCRHDQEPGCALKTAVADSRVHPERLATFQHLLRAGG
ncbi:ribosome small subunit-dependent GTPase A [Thiococcus pfennigii]|jgi:ribosome biogenesis GTPase|uniref:ribosome small subunit-dependent GTPase A n=1 Tax=Thiococcus pfennigii TaxID=1057 RepID=UPI001906D9AD|nr:ribosome small subunit-dependent GTPase A [Thiococcus pfennigii]MBK1700535.1 ribosome small subunit-dependent GTPase A [Thiococcus pfennigii]MBK1730821.1 ribosome small subunit-dependent GTPase A [Thiococcus pfennigii]